MELRIYDEFDPLPDINDIMSQPANDTPSSGRRPWPPVLVREFVKRNAAEVACVRRDHTIGQVADLLASNNIAVIAVYDRGQLCGIAVDDDVMALIKRDGMKAMDYPIEYAMQNKRPVCSATDSPYVVLAMMKEWAWDRIGVAEKGRVIGIVTRRDLVRYVSS